MEEDDNFQTVSGVVNTFSDNASVPVLHNFTRTPSPGWINNPVFTTVLVISAAGSASILGLVCLSKTYRRPSNYLIANLCVVSIWHIFVTISYNVHLSSEGFWPYGPITCYFIAMINRLSNPVLSFTITAISVDRSRVARNPLDSPSSKFVSSEILFIWIFSIIILIPRAIMNIYDDSNEGFNKCTKSLLWNSVFATTFYAVLMVVVIFLVPTFILLKELVTMRTHMKFLTGCQVDQKKLFHRRLRLMQNACIFTAIFITCWLPNGILQFPFDLPASIVDQHVFDSLSSLRNFWWTVSLLNVGLNPILLIILSFDVQEYLASCAA